MREQFESEIPSEKQKKYILSNYLSIPEDNYL
jgi:hypothetical protein